MSYFLITGPFFTLLGVQPGRPSEPLGVPLQQIARTIVDEGHLSAEDAEFLQKMFDFDEIKQKYKPHIVDPIKGCSSFDNDFLSANKIEFVKTWIHIAVDNPRSYFNAWCDITLGYWYLGAEDWIIAEKGYTENNSAIGSDSVNWGQSPNSEGTPLIGSSVSPANYVEVFNQFRGLLILPIYNIAFLVWFAFAIFVVCIHRRQYMYIIPLFPLFFLWLTMLVAAPTFCEFRYMYVFHLSVPLLCMISIMTRSNKSLEKLSK